MSAETRDPPSRATRSLVIGIGNPYRQDDAVGCVAIQQLRSREIEDATLIESDGEGMSLIESWAVYENVILIDAVCSDGDAGKLYEWKADEEPIPVQYFKTSTHFVSVSEAIELARVLERLPKNLVVIGIEGEEFGMGEGLSSAVEDAIPKIKRRVAELIEEFESSGSG